VEEATRLSAILTDFLDFARPRSPQMNDIEVSEVISRVRQNLEQEIHARNIDWSDQDGDSRAVVLGDADLLYQAFLNLAINAFEAMDNGGALEIKVSHEKDRVRIDMADEGHGIKEENLQKVFTPFFTTHEMGTGLGLSVVHNLIEAHGGEITVQSEEGHGTVFSVYLPAGRATIPPGMDRSVEVSGEVAIR
jgi:signal transduction histidine kinase